MLAVTNVTGDISHSEHGSGYPDKLVADITSEDQDFVYLSTLRSSTNNCLCLSISINGMAVNFKVDTGTEVTAITPCINLQPHLRIIKAAEALQITQRLRQKAIDYPGHDRGHSHHIDNIKRFILSMLSPTRTRVPDKLSMSCQIWNGIY